jgi:hypothetical protein
LLLLLLLLLSRVAKGRALKEARRDGRPTDEMPWSRASLQGEQNAAGLVTTLFAT